MVRKTPCLSASARRTSSASSDGPATCAAGVDLMPQAGRPVLPNIDAFQREKVPGSQRAVPGSGSGERRIVYRNSVNPGPTDDLFSSIMCSPPWSRPAARRWSNSRRKFRGLIFSSITAWQPAAEAPAAGNSRCGGTDPNPKVMFRASSRSSQDGGGHLRSGGWRCRPGRALVSPRVMNTIRKISGRLSVAHSTSCRISRSAMVRSGSSDVTIEGI